MMWTITLMLTDKLKMGFLKLSWNVVVAFAVCVWRNLKLTLVSSQSVICGSLTPLECIVQLLWHLLLASSSCCSHHGAAFSAMLSSALTSYRLPSSSSRMISTVAKANPSNPRKTTKVLMIDWIVVECARNQTRRVLLYSKQKWVIQVAQKMHRICKSGKTNRLVTPNSTLKKIKKKMASILLLPVPPS